jgi:hypothetical protein
VTGNWMHSDNDGDAAGLGLGLNIPLGPFLATVGGKGVYTNPKSGDEGYAARRRRPAVENWRQLPSVRRILLLPDSLSSGIQSYQEANAGASWTIMRPLSIEAGYRYLNLEGKDGNRDSTIADGPYSASAPASNPQRRERFPRRIPVYSACALRYSIATWQARSEVNNDKCGNAVHRR